MKYTHKIDFFSNTLRIVVEGGVVVDVEKDGISATCCPECLEEIAGYWLISEKKGKLISMCPSENCSPWPVTEIVKEVTK